MTKGYVAGPSVPSITPARDPFRDCHFVNFRVTDNFPMAAPASAPSGSAAAGSASRVATLLHDLPRHRAAPVVTEPLRPVQRPAPDGSKTYIATHDRTQPPASQVVKTEQQNILLRQFHTRAARKRNSEPTREEPRAKRRDTDAGGGDEA